MIKLFFITFFIAELIIAFAIILKIHQLDKYVNKMNKAVLSSQSKIKSIFFDIRFLIEEFNREFFNLKEIIHQKREEYLLKIIKTSLIYGGIFCLKGKYKKMFLGYEFLREVYEGIQESC